MFNAIDVYRMYIPLLNFRRKTSLKEIEMDSLPKVAPSLPLSPDVDSDMPCPASPFPEHASTATSGGVDGAQADTTMDDETSSLPGIPEDGSRMDHDDAPVSMDNPVIEPLPNLRQANVSDINVGNIHDTVVEPPQQETAESPPNIPMSTTSEESKHLFEEPTMPLQDPLGTSDIDPLLRTSEYSGTRASFGQDEPQVTEATSLNDPVPPVTANTRNQQNIPRMNVDSTASENPSPLPQHHDKATPGLSEPRPLKRLPQHRDNAAKPGLPEDGVSLKCVESRIY